MQQEHKNEMKEMKLLLQTALEKKTGKPQGGCKMC
jgi:hypothetical protein